jgi:hypothetical protein
LRLEGDLRVDRGRAVLVKVEQDQGCDDDLAVEVTWSSEFWTAPGRMEALNPRKGWRQPAPK